MEAVQRPVMQQQRIADRSARIVFVVCAVFLVLVIIAVFLFLGSNAFRLFFEKGGTDLKTFFTSTNWDPTGNNDPNGDSHFGAWGLMLGSIVITLLSVLITIPFAFAMALFLTELSPRWLSTLLQPLLEIFTGMPSVVIGFLGLTVLVPFLQKLVAPFTDNSPTAGFGWGAATLVLVVMILPTVISVSVDSLRAVPPSVREASFALGATRWQTMSSAIIPAAAPGLATGVVLGMARAIGETFAVSLVLFGSGLPKNIFTPLVFFQPNVNITQQIVQDFGETAGVSRDGYWTLAFVLLIISFVFICISRYLASRSVYR